MNKPVPDYMVIAEGLATLITEKQKAYGDSFSKSQHIIKVLYPNGVSVEQYEDFLTVVRVIDKLFRVATRKDAFGESPWMDISGYSLLSLGREEVKRQREATPTVSVVPQVAAEPPLEEGDDLDDGDEEFVDLVAEARRTVGQSKIFDAGYTRPRVIYDPPENHRGPLAKVAGLIGDPTHG
jgi:hypothetical protein